MKLNISCLVSSQTGRNHNFRMKRDLYSNTYCDGCISCPLQWTRKVFFFCFFSSKEIIYFFFFFLRDHIMVLFFFFFFIFFFRAHIISYAFKMRHDYLSTNYLDKKYLPSEHSEMRKIRIDLSNSLQR